MARQTRHADEHDASSSWRHVLHWHAGERKAIKRRANRRERREAKAVAREERS